MATAGSIIVELLAKTGAFDTDIDRSSKQAQKRMREMQKSVEAAGAAMGVALAAGAAAAVVFTKKWIDGLDALNDASDATGASIENLSALEDVAVRTGTSMDSATNALVKFNMGLKGTDDDGKAGKALEAIGLNIAKLRDMDPAEALLQTAVALAKFADDGDKARLVQELFGKSVREMAPLLKDLAEKGQLVATVTTEQAKEAEAFNKELFALQKNITDLGRAFASDLVIGINAAAKELRESGLWEGLKTLFGGTEQYKKDKRFADLTEELLQLEAQLDQIKARQKDNPIFAFLTGGERGSTERKLAAVRAQLAPLLAERQAMPEAISFGALRRSEGSYRPGIGAVDTSKGKAGPKGPDPDADFKSYLNNLQQQIQKVQELTVSEKLLDDLRRGALTATPAQQKQLTALARQIDEEKSALAIAKERQAQRNKEYEDAKEFLEKTDAETKQRLDSLLAQGPNAQLERQRADLMFLADLVEKGKLSPEVFKDVSTGMLGLNQRVQEGVSGMEQFAAVGLDAMHALALGGADADDVFKRMLLSLADLVFQIGVVEPMMAKLRESTKGTSSSGGGIFQSILGAVAGAFGGGPLPSPVYSGGRAFGGDVLPGQSFDVGERGPERFVPRTAGYVLPSSEGSQAEGLTVINQTTGRVDKATRVPMGKGQKALLLQEFLGSAALALANPNSVMSQALKQHYNVRQQRS